MANQKEKSGFMAWYESYKGQRVVGMVYSIGASVVIIGALFKILHWPGASIVLMIGMFTEAFLFLIGCLDKPHASYHWEEVFPQLLGHGADPELIAEKASQPRPTLLGGGAVAPAAAAPAAGAHVEAKSLSDADLASMKEGINNLAKTAGQLADLSKVAASTAKLGEKAEAAAEAADKFAQAAGALGANNEKLNASMAACATSLEGAVAGSKAYKEAVEAASKNAVAFSADVEKIHAAMAEAAKANAEYEAGAKKLAKQVSDLNGIYGNMLNAIA